MENNSISFSIVLMLVVATTLVSHIECNDNLRVAYEWKEIDFAFPTEAARAEAIANQSFIPENVIPVGLEVYQNRLFITLPRWKPGVPASLAYINIDDNKTKSPLLHPYPSWEQHRMEGNDTPEIISPFRIRADKCGRLWVLDTGINDILDEAAPLSVPRLLVYNLRNDFLEHTYEFPKDQVKKSSFFANIAVEDGDCDNTYVYSADLGKPGLVVYSYLQKRSWRVAHHFFNPDPLAGNYSIGGIAFQWSDGLFGLAISKQEDGYATLYFHPLNSFHEFSVSTRILRDENLATSITNYKDFKVLGSRGPNSQSGASFLDQLTGVLFYSLPNLNAVACWKTTNRTQYSFKSQGRVYMSDTEMVFPNDIKVDDQDRLWVLSDRLQQFMYSSLNKNEVNFRILTAHVKDAIENTACDTKTKALPELINRLGDILRPSTQAPVPKGSGTNQLMSAINVICLGAVSVIFKWILL